MIVYLEIPNQVRADRASDAIDYIRSRLGEITTQGFKERDAMRSAYLEFLTNQLGRQVIEKRLTGSEPQFFVVCEDEQDAVLVKLKFF